MSQLADQDIRALVDAYRVLHGHVDSKVERAAASDPAFFSHYLRLAGAALGAGHLSPKMVQFVMLAANASITHMSPEMSQCNIEAARAQGASDAELREVLQIASVLGIHGYMTGSKVLLEEVARASGAALDHREPLNAQEVQIRDRFREGRQYWSDQLQDLLQACPEFFDAYAGFSSHPWAAGVLSPKDKELLYVAIDVQTTHLFEPGIRIHTANALRYGATRQEVSQVATIVSCLGMQTYLMGVSAMAAIT